MNINFLPQSFALTQDSSAETEFEVSYTDGSFINVSSGWDAKFTLYSLTQPDRAGAILDLDSTAFGFHNGSVTIDFSAAMINDIHSGTYGYQINISDDGFAAANHCIAAGQIQVVPSAYGL